MGVSFINVGGVLFNLAVIAGVLLLLVVVVGGALLLLSLLRHQYGNREHNRSAVNLKSMAQAVPSYRSKLPQLTKELSRARRLERPMTLLAIRPMSALLGIASEEETKDGHDTQSYRLDPIDFLYCGCALRDALREIDIAAYDGAHNQFVVALPESTKKQAVLAVNRLNDIIGDRIASQLYVGIAEFPEDGLTIEDLIKRAMEPTNRELGAHDQAEDREPATPLWQKHATMIRENERASS
ncbi:MAG: hypothetical protein OEU36_14635 [Gammaproteobacteria bacterium]|nr:hypothetical protein [Gammaproteobacteria bacterium]